MSYDLRASSAITSDKKLESYHLLWAEGCSNGHRGVLLTIYIRCVRIMMTTIHHHYRQFHISALYVIPLPRCFHRAVDALALTYNYVTN